MTQPPTIVPFWAGILAAIVEKKGGQVAILDLNAIRMNYGGDFVPMDIIRNEISSEEWDLIGIGGLTTMYRRIKQLIQFSRKLFPDTTIVSGGGWSTYNPDEILQLVPEIDMVCIGDGEYSITELCQKMIAGEDYGPETIKRLRQSIFNVYVQNHRLNPEGEAQVGTWSHGPRRVDHIGLWEEGGVDFSAVFEGLHAIEYSGYLTIHQSFQGVMPVSEAVSRSSKFLASMTNLV